MIEINSSIKKETEAIKTPELKSDFPIFYSLASKMKEPIKNGEYTSIIGDDRRGRLPSLVFTQLINLINSENGRPNVHLVFLPGLRVEQQGVDALNYLKDELQKRQQFLSGKDLYKKTLLVTDHLMYGRTLDLFSQLFVESAIDFDVAALGIESEESYYRRLEHFPPSSKLFFGVSRDEVRLGEIPQASGVYKTEIGLTKKLFDSDIQNLVNSTRGDVKIMADILKRNLF